MSAADIESISHLDFSEPKLTCEVKDSADLICQVTAEWLLLCAMCDAPGQLYCHEDKITVDAAIAAGLSRYCPVCGHESSMAMPRHRFELIGAR